MNIYNKILKLFGVLLLSILIFTSCNDEAVNMDESSLSSNGLKVITYNNGGNGKAILPTSIATFDSQLTYDNYIDDLDAQVEAWDDAFVAQWAHLDEESLNLKEEELNFDSEKPMTDFENSIGLQSLRQKYLAEEEVWLNNEILDEATDPDIKPEYDFDNKEMVLLNKYAEVQIGSTIIKQLSSKEIELINDMKRFGGQKNVQLIEEGASLVIADADYNTLIDFNNGDSSVVEQDNVTVQQSTTSDCKYFRTNNKTIYYDNGGRKVKLRVKFGNVTNFYFEAKARIKAYKKKRSRWKKRRTNLGVKVATGTFCEDDYRYDKSWKRKRRKRLARRIIRFGAGNKHAKSTGESVAGGFEYAGNSTTLRLEW